MSSPMNRPFLRAGLGLALSLLLGLLLPSPVRADAGRWLGSPSYAELRSEIDALRGVAASRSLSAEQQQRYNDLITLQAAIVRSDDRAQLDNRSGHSLGLFARSKTAPADAAAEFLVLAPGHASDDDLDLIALYLPAGVALEWGDGRSLAAAPAPRLARLLEGQQLQVSDPLVVDPASGTGGPPPAPSTPAPAPAAPPTATKGSGISASATAASSTAAATAAASAAQPVVYRLDLPSFAVVGSDPQVTSLPAMAQDDLDAHPETAPVD